MTQDAKNGYCSGEIVTRIYKVKKHAKLVQIRPTKNTFSISARHTKIKKGSELKIDLIIPQLGYLHIFEKNSNNKYTLLFPNGYQQNNYVTAGKMTITDDKNWKLQIQSGPYGKHKLYAVLNTKPSNLFQKKSIELSNKIKLFPDSSSADMLFITQCKNSLSDCKTNAKITSTSTCYFNSPNDCP